MMVIIGPAAVGQSEGGGVRAGHSLLLLRGLSSSCCELLFPAAAAVTHHHSTVPSPSNSLRKLPVLVLRFVKAPAFHPLRLRVLSLYAFFSFHQYFGIHTQPTPCRGPSKISSSTTMRKRHVPSVSRSLISQIEAFGLASAVIRCVLAACLETRPPANEPSQICQFCYHNVRNNMNGLCPACRRPYDDANIEFRKPGPEEYPSLPTRSSAPTLTPIAGKLSGEPNKPPSKRSSPPPPKRKLRSARPTPFPASILLASASCKRTWFM
jgi:hypothetical protein